MSFLRSQGNLFGEKPIPEQLSEIKVETSPVLPTPAQILERVEQQAMRQLKSEQPTLALMAECVVIDPGADIHPEDSSLWLTLLSRTRETDKNLQAILSYLRGAGAKLVVSNKFGYAIVSIIDPSGVNGWPSQEMYDQEREPLRKNKEYGDKVKELLWQLRNPKPTLT